MLPKKQIWFFYSSSKCVVKQQRQLATPTMHVAQELLANIQWSGGSRSCAKEMRGLKRRSVVASHQKLAMTNWQIKADSLTTTGEVAVEHSMVVWHLKQIEKVKKLVKWVPLELPQIKNLVFWSVFSYSVHQWTISQIVTCDEKWILGLPWWLSGKESTCKSRRHRFDPWSRKIPHVREQLSLCTTTIEPVL